MLLRKGETASALAAIALLVAILASANAVVNSIKIQAEALGAIVNVSETYLIMSSNSRSITDSEIDAKLANQLKTTTDFKYILPQRALTAILTVNSGNYTVLIRGVEQADNFLKARRAQIDGTITRSKTAVNFGEILAQVTSVKLGDKVKLTAGGSTLEAKVVGIVRTLTEVDVELIVPMETANNLTGGDSKISLIEFALKDDVDADEALNRIIASLPKDVRIVKTQQLKKFMQETNKQTLAFLNLWSLAVYAVVAATSYVIATRLVTESHYELTMLRALGAKKRHAFTLVLTHTAIIAILSSMLGITLGTVGVQAASAALRWTRPDTEMTLFLEVWQALEILLFTLSSSILGCLYPASRAARIEFREQPL